MDHTSERVPAPNIDYFGCDRCGQMFPPQMRCDVVIRLASSTYDDDEYKHQVCTNCIRLITMTFRFTEARKVMEQQIRQGRR